MIFEKFFKRLVDEAVKGLPISSLASGFKWGNSGGVTEHYSRWVFASVDVISNMLAAVEWHLYQVKGKDVVEVPNHQLMGLLWKFNDKMTKYDAIKLSVVYFLLQGEFYWMLEKDARGTISAIYPINPTLVTKVMGEDKKTITGYKYQGDTVASDKMLYFRNPDPSDPSRGRSHLSAIRETVETDDRMVKWNKNLMEKGAKPSVVVEVPAALDPNTQKILASQFNEVYGGFENANGVMVLGNGAKLNPFSIPPKDLEWIAGRGMNRDEILSIFGVPKILLGLEGQYNRATAETSEMVFGRYRLDPLMTMITEQLNEFMVPLFGKDLYLGFDSFAPEDKELLMNKLNNLTNKVLTTNEARQELGKEPLIGGDAIYTSIVNVPTMTPSGKKSCDCGHDHKESSNVVMRKREIDGRVSVKIARKVLARVAARNFKSNDIAKDIAEKVGQKIFKSEKKVLTIKEKKSFEFDSATKENLWREYVSIKNQDATSWKMKLKQIFERQGNGVIDNIKKTGKKNGKNNFKKIKPADLLFDPEAEAKTTMTIIEPQYYLSMILGADTGVSLINEPKLNLNEIPKVKEWLEKTAEKYAESITTTTADDFARLLTAGIENGESVNELSDRIKEYIDGVADYRADMIARTESARALTAGEAFAWDEYGIKDVEWYLAGTDPCEVCQANSQADWSTKEAQSGISEYSHPNCECVFLPK